MIRLMVLRKNGAYFCKILWLKVGLWKQKSVRESPFQMRRQCPEVVKWTYSKTARWFLVLKLKETITPTSIVAQVSVRCIFGPLGIEKMIWNNKQKNMISNTHLGFQLMRSLHSTHCHLEATSLLLVVKWLREVKVIKQTTKPIAVTIGGARKMPVNTAIRFASNGNASSPGKLQN